MLGETGLEPLGGYGRVNVHRLQESARPRLIVRIRPRLRDRNGRFLPSPKVPLAELDRTLNRHIQEHHPVNFMTKLPLELRRIIYGYIMSDAPVLCAVTKTGTKGCGQKNAFASSLRVNQEMHRELSPMLYRNCLFHFKLATKAQRRRRAGKVDNTAPWCAKFLRTVGKENASEIRKIQIGLESMKTVLTTLLLSDHS